MRWIVGGKAVERGGASTSQMGRFETELLANNENLAALADLSGMWIDRVHDHDPPRRVVLDMDSSVSPTFGEQEGTAYNGHFGCTCYHPLFVFNQFGEAGFEEAAQRVEGGIELPSPQRRRLVQGAPASSPAATDSAAGRR